MGSNWFVFPIGDGPSSYDDHTAGPGRNYYACQATSQALYRRLLARSGARGRATSSGSEPLVVLITELQEMEQLDNLHHQSVLDEIAKLGFDRYFVIALFRERQGSSGYDTIIDRVTRRGNKIVIRAQFWELNETGSAVTHRDTLPYHIIKVRKEIEVELKRQVMTPPPIPSR